MNFSDWYTDTVDVYRTTAETNANGLTRNVRSQIYQAIPCRIYTDNPSAPTMTQDAANVNQSCKIALDNSWVINPGDELILHRGGGLGVTSASRGFASEPHHHYEPFGAVMPQLAHQEVLVLNEVRI